MGGSFADVMCTFNLIHMRVCVKKAIILVQGNYYMLVMFLDKMSLVE